MRSKVQMDDNLIAGIVPVPLVSKDSTGGAGASGSTSEGVGSAAASSAPPSRYESQKRRDWNTFGQYLKNQKPPLYPAGSSMRGPWILGLLAAVENITGSVIHGRRERASGLPKEFDAEKLQRNEGHASSGDGGSRGQIDYVKPKAKQEPLTDRGKSPISEENAWGESPMQGHKPSDKPIGQGMVVASASGTNEGRVDLEMQKLDSQQKVKPKSGVQTVTKILLASSLPAGHSLSSMAKGSSISRPIYCFTAAATSIVVLGCLLALMVADKHPKLAGYAGKLAIFFASIAFFSTFFI